MASKVLAEESRGKTKELPSREGIYSYTAGRIDTVLPSWPTLLHSPLAVLALALPRVGRQPRRCQLVRSNCVIFPSRTPGTHNGHR